MKSITHCTVFQVISILYQQKCSWNLVNEAKHTCVSNRKSAIPANFHRHCGHTVIVAWNK